MTPRLRPLDLLARALLVGAVVAPLLLALAQAVPARPDLRWMAAIPFGGPVMGVPIEHRFDPPWGFSVILTNRGNAESEDVRIVLAAADPVPPPRPSHVDVFDRGTGEYAVTPTEDGTVIDLDPLEPGETVRVVLFRASSRDVREVLHGGEPVAPSEALPRFDTRVRLPRWAVLAGLFLVAGLAVQVLALRRRVAARPA